MRVARLDSSGWSKAYAVVGVLSYMVSLRLEAEDIYSLGFVRIPADV